MRLGIVGCGAIGASIAREVARGGIANVELAGLCKGSSDKAWHLAQELACHGHIPCLALEELAGTCDFLVEAASKAAMPGIVRAALQAGKSILAMSVGGLVDAPDLPDLARRHHARLYLPSGALAGIDGILAAQAAGLDEVGLTTTKKPASLRGAPYLQARGIDLEGLTGPTVIFEGSAREAISGFPANTNVAITLSHAGIGLDRTRMRIIADPACSRTRHEISASGPVCDIRCTIESEVAPDNPRTSHQAILSALCVIRQAADSLRIGN